MKKIFVLLMCCFGFVMCRKDDSSSFHDLSGPNTLQGVAVLYDTMTGNYNYTIIKSLDVFIRDSSNPSTYLSKNKTDDHGRYAFNGIDTNKSYTVYASIDTGAIRFYGEINYPKNTTHNYQKDTLKLFPSPYNQNGMFIRTVDSLNGPLPNINIYVFYSKVKWLADDSVGKTFRLQSDLFGRALKMNVTPGWYYLTAIDSVGKLIIKAKDSIHINAQGINSKTIVLKHG
jgi:hypothetical protein